MPTDITSISVVDSCYERLKEDVLSFRELLYVGEDSG